jgi:hypothetical protein
MPLSTSEAAAELGRLGMAKRWAGTTPEQRREATRKARLASAVKTVSVAAGTGELTDEQKDQIHSALYGLGGVA